MGTIKFEIDLPEFEKELSINVTIHRDGEVVYSTTSSPSMGSILNSEDMSKKNEEKPALVSSRGLVETSSEKVEAIKESKPKKSTSKKMGGNFMDLDF